jgi:hypothetical protein
MKKHNLLLTNVERLDKMLFLLNFVFTSSVYPPNSECKQARFFKKTKTIAMKKLYIILLVLTFIPFVSIGQFGMNISGSHVIVHADTYLIIADDNSGTYCDLTISNTDGLTIRPNAFVTTENLNLINDDPSLPDIDANLIVESNSQGTGSFIVNHDVTHTGKGRAKIQSFITGDAGNYYMHCVSATVQDINPAYINSVRLQQFDMTYLDTFAWYWDGSVADISNGQAWVNIWPYDYEVPLGWGLALTNDDAGDGTIEMFGYPKSGDITFNTHYVVGNTIELIGNPYSSAIDFDEFYQDNMGEILPHFYIYDNGGGNYVVYQYPGVGSPYIQVGQSFFVNTRPATYSVVFSNSHRVHNNVAFREFTPNLLNVSVEGGSNGFRDNLYVRFDPQATSYYDEEIDALKWRSISEGATMIYSIAEDDSTLAVNVLPDDNLGNVMISVPVHFECGEDAEYTFTFEGLESFNEDVEIWLEDLQTEIWNSITPGHNEYLFNASPSEVKHRFNIHFFGPTSIFEDQANIEDEHIKIYAYGNEAYVLNNSNETIKNVTIYNLMGQTIYQGKLPQQTLNKIFVSGQTGYYVVSVETNKNIYTEKVFILK